VRALRPPLVDNAIAALSWSQSAARACAARVGATDRQGPLGNDANEIVDGTGTAVRGRREIEEARDLSGVQVDGDGRGRHRRMSMSATRRSGDIGSPSRAFRS